MHYTVRLIPEPLTRRIRFRHIVVEALSVRS